MPAAAAMSSSRVAPKPCAKACSAASSRRSGVARAAGLARGRPMFAKISTCE